MKYHISFDLELLKNQYPGKYFSLEGIDGSGKSTQLHLVAEKLRKDGLSVTLTSEPKTGTVVEKIIREVLSGKEKMPSAAFQYLYSADRVINQETIVKPALSKGDIVLSHRSFWSVIPYGVMDRGLENYNEEDTEILMVAQGLLSMYHQFVCPDITFYLDVSVDTAMKRLKGMDKTKDIYEKKDKLLQIARGYEWEMQRFPEQFVRFNGEKSEEEIAKEIFDYIKKSIKKQDPSA